MNRASVSSFHASIACALLGIGLCLTPPAQAARPLGIDTAVYNGTNVNWATVYANGYRFAFTKASQGTSIADSTFTTNMKNAPAAGLVIGPYHFATPTNNTALAEANYFVAIAGKYMTNGYLPPVLDLERGDSLGKTALSTWANTFCNRVKTLTGISPIIYTGQSFASTYLNSTVTNWDVWIAQWPFTPDPQTGNPSCLPWTKWTFWQYAGDVSGIPGVPSSTDLDAFNGTLAQLYSYVIGGVANTPPGITQQPSNQSVVSGGTANFTVGASGSNPLSFQWQKNQGNLSNGGHYSGCTTATLTITGADNNDVASYRCVVTNSLGSTNSSAATLTMAVGCAPGTLVNADFEGGNTGGVAAGWTGYQRAPNPTTTDWSIQTASPPTGGGAQYQQIANTSSTGGGGVRQDITGCIIGATYTISGWMRGNSGSATCTVKCSPSASTSWATANDLNPPQTYSGSTWTAFSGTVVAIGTTMTLWLDGQTGGSGLNKAECFDSVTLTCAGAAVPPSISQQPVNQAVITGGSASFTIGATGSDPLSYQWQKNNANLGNGGHYSGSTTATLTIISADTNDAANYRCVVTNAFGSTNSAAAALTVTNASTPPSIVQQPTSQSVVAGGTASFTVLASGSNPLSYQWQKNNVNLGNGGHYSGCTAGTLTITGADANDAASYRCVVTNAYGSTNSATATLTLVIPNPCVATLNADFESGFNLAGGGYIANNWTEWESDPGAVTGYDEITLVHGGAHSQRVRVSGGTNGTSGGVYQCVPVTAGQPYTVNVWIYSGDAATTCSLGVDPAGGTNANSGVTWSSGTTNVAWVQKTWSGTATANYITVYCKAASSDNAKRNGYFDDLAPAGLTAPLQLVCQWNGSVMTLTWPECPGARLEQANNLTEPVSWLTITNQTEVSNGQKRVSLSPAQSAGFFRLVVE